MCINQREEICAHVVFFLIDSSLVGIYLERTFTPTPVGYLTGGSMPKIVKMGGQGELEKGEKTKIEKEEEESRTAAAAVSVIVFNVLLLLLLLLLLQFYKKKSPF